jgi:hypothetical protein
MPVSWLNPGAVTADAPSSRPGPTPLRLESKPADLARKRAFYDKALGHQNIEERVFVGATTGQIPASPIAPSQTTDAAFRA